MAEPGARRVPMAFIPGALFRVPGLTWQGLATAAALYSFARRSDDGGLSECRASLPELAERSGRSLRSIPRDLDALEAQGIIERERTTDTGARKGRNLYRFLLPEPPKDRFALVPLAHFGRTKGPALAVLAALAYHADGERRAWPSLAKLAATARLAESTTSEALKALASAGIVEDEGPAPMPAPAGSKPRRAPRQRRIVMPEPSAPRQPARPESPAARRIAARHEAGKVRAIAPPPAPGSEAAEMLAWWEYHESKMREQIERNQKERAEAESIGPPRFFASFRDATGEEIRIGVGA